MTLDDILKDLETSASMEKVASAPAEAAPSVSESLQSILEKKASADLSADAMKAGEAVAKELLTKLANEIQIANDTIVAKDDTKVVPVETAGTVEDVLKATTGQALNRGATSDDRVDSMIDEGKGQPAGEPINEQEKTAQENATMANAILMKLAQIVGETPTVDSAAVNVQGAAVPNKIQEDNAVITAADDAKVQALPGAEGTINNILEQVVATAMAQGAGSENLVAAPGPVEGATVGATGEEGATGDEHEKAAAVSALIGEGLDFDTAVALVKQAEAELFQDYVDFEKQAAFEALVGAGVDFDQAIDMVKQAEQEIYGANFPEGDLEKEAGILDTIKNFASTAGKAIKSDAAKVPGQLGNISLAAKNNGVFTKGTGSTVKALAGNKAIQAGAAGLVGAGAVGYGASKAFGQEKKASAGEIARGIVSPAWMKSNIAKQHGHKEGTGDNWGQVLGTHAGGLARANLRSDVHGLTGAGLGAAGGAALAAILRQNPETAATIGAGIGGTAGIIHGALTSIKNQAKEFHKQYEKKAAFDALVEAGMDFDTAITLVKQAEEALAAE